MNGRRAGIVILVAAALFAWWQAVWRFVLPGWPHPSIKAFSTFSIDARDLQQRAADGIPVELQIGDRRLELDLEEISVQADDCTVIELTEDGASESDAPDSVTYRGSPVDAAEEAVARLGIGEVSVSGSVLLVDEWWFIEPLARYRAGADPDEHIAYRIEDAQFSLDFGGDAVPREERQGEGEGGRDENGSATDGGTTPIGAVCVADTESMDRAAATDRYWQHYQQNLVTMINELYGRETGHEFRVHWYLGDRRGALSSRDSIELFHQLEATSAEALGDLRSPERRERLDIEVVHLTTGKDLSGTVVGRAFRPGVYGLTQYRVIGPWPWAVTGGVFGGMSFPPVGLVQALIVAAHELGHNFDGHHDEADKWCATRFVWCFGYVRTLMWKTAWSDNVHRFSDGTRNVTHNNRQRIRTNIESGRDEWL